jgi:tetratricopeptide (TPR) repeat protein
MMPFLSHLRCRAVRVGILLLAAAGLAAVALPGRASTPAPRPVSTDPLNLTPAVHEAFQHFYDLDYAGALRRFEAVEAAHPGDPIAADYVLNATVFQALYDLDLLDTTLYAHDGFLSNRRPVAEDKATTQQVDALTGHAIDLAERRLKADPKDVNALFARSWAQSLHATYIGLVQHSFVAALRGALDARNGDDTVLKLDPNYADAELVVGVHQYVVGALPFGFKLLAGIAGIHGSKSKGIAMLRDDGERGVISSVEARTALMLFLRRERRYGEAEQIAATLTRQYPRDFLFRLEEANLEKDAGDAQQAIATYRQVISDARKPGYFTNAHLELAEFGLGETLRGQNEHAAAVRAFAAALRQPTLGPALRQRAELALGHEYDTLHERGKAVAEYRKVVTEAPDSREAAEAKDDLAIPPSS